jgi:hypothetical protein
MVNALLLLMLLLGGALAGEWQREGESADEKLVLGADGRGELGGMRLSWRDEDGKTLVVRFEAVPQDVRFQYRLDVDGGVLTLQDAQGESATYRREGGAKGAADAEATTRPGGDAPATSTTTSTTVSGTAYEAQGWAVDLEPGWKAQAQGETTLLVPPEVIVFSELYGISSKPVEPTAELFDAQVAATSPTFERKADPEALENGGMRLVYEGLNHDGKPVRTVILARKIGDRAVWVGGMGLADLLAKREPAMRRMCASLRAPKPPVKRP